MSECPHSWRLESADDGRIAWRCAWCGRHLTTTPEDVARSEQHEKEQAEILSSMGDEIDNAAPLYDENATLRAQVEWLAEACAELENDSRYGFGEERTSTSEQWKQAALRGLHTDTPDSEKAEVE